MILFDLEADGLLDTATKVHCLCGIDLTARRAFTYRGEELGAAFAWLLSPCSILVGHMILEYDIPVIEKLYPQVGHYRGKFIDTGLLCRHLQPGGRHDLDTYGKLFGIEKPAIKDWGGLSVEEYIHRCQEDVRINYRLLSYLSEQHNFTVTPDLAVEYSDD